MSDPRDDFHAEPPKQPDLFDPMDRLKLELNDRDNAKRLYSRLKDELVYVPGLGWGAWNGTHFDFDGGEEAALGKTLDVLPVMIEEEIAAADRQPVPKYLIDQKCADENIEPDVAERKIKASRRQKKRAFAIKCGDNARAKASLEAGRPLFRVFMDDLDNDPWRLTCANGVLDLNAIGESPPDAEEDDERIDRWRNCLGKFDPGMRGTRAPAAAFDPAALCPRWHKFVSRAFPEANHAAYLRRVMGYLLSGRNDRQVAVIFLGQGGNGKSTVENAIEAVMGGYVGICRVQMFLEQSKNAGNGPTPEEAVLPGARVYLASEPEANAVLGASMIKGITGGTPRQSRQMHTKPFIWRPIGVPVLSFNKMPRITDESEGMWRRLLPVHFSVKLHELPEEERVSPAEMERILVEEASGILNWAIQGWVEYKDIGLSPPPEMLELKARLRAMSDPVGEFLSDCTVPQTGGKISNSELMATYEKWSEVNGMQPISKGNVRKALNAKDLRSRKISTMHWIDIGWQDTDEVRDLLRGDVPPNASVDNPDGDDLR